MKTGYVKLWRKTLDSGMLQNPKLLTVWVWCLLKAAHKETNAMVGFQEIMLEPGQFIFTRKAASQELCMSERSIRTCFDTLKKLKNVTSKTTNKFSVISIVNWGVYQKENCKTGQQAVQRTTSKRPANPITPIINKNVKKIKNTPLPPKKDSTEQKPIIPEWLPKKAWDEFVQHRIEIKAGLSPLAEAKALKSLLRLKEEGDDPQEVIDQTIANGWKGFFAVKRNGGGKPPWKSHEEKEQLESRYRMARSISKADGEGNLAKYLEKYKIPKEAYNEWNSTN